VRGEQPRGSDKQAMQRDKLAVSLAFRGVNFKGSLPDSISQFVEGARKYGNSQVFWILLVKVLQTSESKFHPNSCDAIL
jgi:hypothetical protein